jgi:hypothetical protein
MLMPVLLRHPAIATGRGAAVDDMHVGVRVHVADHLREQGEWKRMAYLCRCPFGFGVAGLQSASMAGLGFSCLNASFVPDGAKTWRPVVPLPTLPEVAFSLLPPRAGETTLVGEVRQMLAVQLS